MTPREHSSLRVDRDVEIPMRDGAVTRGDVYRPARGRHAVILERTPYDKSKALYMLNPLRAAAHGYCVVLQDVRGRYASEGSFEPYVDEMDDGFDSVAWCADAPFSTGEVGMIGASYVGATQWLAARARPPGLRCIVPQLTPTGWGDGWTYRNGALEWGLMVTWLLPDLAPAAARALGDARLEEELVRCLDDLASHFWTLPLAELALTRELTPYFHEWLAHPPDDRYWERMRVDARDVAVPALSVGGWYDIFKDGTCAAHTRLCERGATPEARSGARLVVGPWAHAMPTSRIVGAHDFGARSAQGAIPQSLDLDAEYLRFFDRWLRGIPHDGDPVRWFEMGTNRWRSGPLWPPGGGRELRLHLRSRGRANAVDGDGALEQDPPGHEPPDRFTYDPRDPVPTLGGALCCESFGYAVGVADQRPAERRQDVLVYTSRELEHDLDVAGTVRATIWLATDAADTDVTVKLVDVSPDGRARNVVDSVARASHMHGPAPLEPGAPRAYELDVGVTANVFLRGHRLRVEVSSSNFPRFDRNLGRGESLATAVDLVAASQLVLHDTEYPSWISLPLGDG